MKKIISAVIVIAMLLSTVLMVIPAGAAEAVQVTDVTSFNNALGYASGDTTITIPSGTTIAPASLDWPADAETKITITGQGTLDLSALSEVSIGCELVIDNINLIFRNGSKLYAEGNPFTIKENVKVSYKAADGTAVDTLTDIDMEIFGGSKTKAIVGDTYINIQSGTYTRIYGGSNNVAIMGNTNVYIGGNTNASLPEGDQTPGTYGWRSHKMKWVFYGGSYVGNVSGNTNIIVEGNAKANYIYGGNSGVGDIGGYAKLTFGGNASAMDITAGSNGADPTCDLIVTMTGGTVEQIFGAQGADNTGNVWIKVLGGTVMRRIYGGVYNEWSFGDGWTTANCVTGNITVFLGDSANITCTFDDDKGIMARSRYKSNLDKGTSTIIYGGTTAYNNNHSKTGRLDYTSLLGSLSGADTTHTMSYSVSGATVTETCTTCGNSHSGTVTFGLEGNNTQQLYTGAPIECAMYEISSSWISGPVGSISYRNNVSVGEATATLALELGLATDTLTKTFAIVEDDTLVEGDYDQNGSIEVTYTISETYTFFVPERLALGEKGEEVPLTMAVENVIIAPQWVLNISVASANGFNVVDAESGEALAYSITYGEGAKAENTTDPVTIMSVRWNDEDQSAEAGVGISRYENMVATLETAGDRYLYSDSLTFTVAPEYEGIIPLVNGQEFDTNEFHLGDGSLLYVKEQVADTYENGVATFNSYVNELKSLGYSLYTTNKIDNNHFATLTTSEHIVNVMYVDYYKDIRVTTDLRSTFSLPGLERENVYAKSSENYSSLTLIGGVDGHNITWPGKMGYVYQLEDGSFFIIDGGYGKEVGAHGSAMYAIEKVLMEYAPDKNNIVIAGWLITHMHEDHFGAFIDLSTNADFAELKSKVTIEKLIYTKDATEVIKRIDDARGDTWNQNFFAQFQNAIDNFGEKIKSKVKTHVGQKFFIRNMELTVYTSQDLLHGSEHYIEGDRYDPLLTGSDALKDSKYMNNTSTTIMVEFEGKKALYMGDASAATNPYVTARIYDEALAEIQILQVAHHGYGDTAATDVYSKIVNGGNLELILWPSEAEHFYGENVPGDYRVDKDCHNAFSISFNWILLASDAKIYVHGQHNITIVDFQTYETTGFRHPCQDYRTYAESQK